MSSPPRKIVQAWLTTPTTGVIIGRPSWPPHCRAAGLAWRTDATNADTAYRRNFIRHDLLPLLRSRLNRRADEAILRLAQAAAGADEVLEALARSALARGEGAASSPRRCGAPEPAAGPS